MQASVLGNRSEMKARDYCCCAIPLVNAGIYALLIEQFVLGITAGTLSIATSSSKWYIYATFSEA